MSDFRYAPIYGRNPWLMVEEADEVADFFRNSGTPFVSHRRDIVHFGSQPHVYWIESGLVASSATTDVDKVRWIGLFSRRTLLGSVRAIGHGKAAMTLMATAVTDVSGFAIPLELYARWVSENPERERATASPSPSVRLRAFSSTTSAPSTTASRSPLRCSFAPQASPRRSCPPRCRGTFPSPTSRASCTPSAP